MLGVSNKCNDKNALAIAFGETRSTRSVVFWENGDTEGCFPNTDMRTRMRGVFQEHGYARIDTNAYVMSIGNHEMHEIHESDRYRNRKQ